MEVSKNYINKFMKFPVRFEKIESIDSNDTRFTKVKIFLMHLGQNYNGSVFEKEVVQTAIPTLQYIPIVGFIEENQFGEKDFSDHRYVIIINSKGDYEEKYLGVPYGVIVSNGDNNAHFETVMCDDGYEREFLVVEGLLWNMFKDSKMIMERDFRKGHSMELWNPEDSEFTGEETNPVDGYINENGLFVFTKFSFRAACILGDQYEPAMINSSVVINNTKFTMADFLKEMQSEINDKFTKFAKLKENLEKGGMEMADVENKKPKVDKEDVTEIVVEEVVTEESGTQTETDNTGSDNTNTQTENTGDDNTGSDSNDSTEVQTGDNTGDGNDTTNTETNGNGDTTGSDDTNGDTNGGDTTNTETETTNTTKTGDNTGNGGDGDGDGDGSTDYQVQYSDLKIKYDELESKYQSVVNELGEIKPKYEQYVADEQKRSEVELEAAKDAVFTKFVNIIGENPDFIELQRNKANLSLDEIKNRCNSIYTDATLSKNFGKKSQTNSLGINDDEDCTDSKYVYSERYGVIHKH